MQWARSVLLAGILVFTGALAWSQQPGPARGAGDAQDQAGAPVATDEDCEQEQRDAASRPVEKTRTSAEQPLRPGRPASGVEPREREVRAVVPAATEPDLEAIGRGISTRPLTPELIAQVVEVAREINPMLASRLQALQRRDPAEFEQAVRTTGWRLLGMAELKQRDPELYGFKVLELRYEQQAERKAAEVREAIKTGTGDVARLQEDLRTLVRTQLALGMGARAEYLSRLREHLDRIEGEIDREAMQFDENVDSRIEQMLRDPAVRAGGRFAADR